ncbi:MAG: response regulator transcription factor [Anaerolineae bacterium]|nr:response regulator transcription factor [Anaerolineae bacterium]
MVKRNPMRGRFRVLVIDDEPETLKMLRIMLTAEGFDVIPAQGAIEGLRAAYQSHPDAILLDVMMPDVDGFEVCQRLREMTDVPILFVTARGTIEDIVRGFSLGADDYVVKPFATSELVSRLVASLRRAGERDDESVEVLFPSGSIVLDCGRHELLIGSETVYLTPKEFEVLRLLIRHAGKVLSADAILTQVWGPDRIGEPDLVKQYVYKLRQKIEADPDTPVYIQTVRGGGYYFDTGDLL